MKLKKVDFENDIEATIWLNSFQAMMTVGTKWFVGNPHQIRESIESADTDDMFVNAMLFANRITEKYKAMAK